MDIILASTSLLVTAMGFRMVIKGLTTIRKKKKKGETKYGEDNC